jgi:membrane associated rhomboid family serine protease
MAYYRYSTYYRPSPFGGFRFFPPVIKALLLSNAAVFLLAVFFGAFRIGETQLVAIITSIFALYPIDGGFQVWQLFTYMFMHGGFMHLLFNMFALWMFGMDLENEWGSRRFLFYYLVCGVGAGISNLFIGPLFGPAAPTVGASGAVYGILLAFGVMYPDRPIFLYFLLPVKAKYFVIFFLVLEMYAGIAGTPDGIAHFAHLGGAAVGLILLMIYLDRIPLRIWWSNWQAAMKRPVRYGDSYRERYHEQVSDARYHDVTGGEEDEVDQERIDAILDKISRDGYQSLTEEEKRILFDASKKLN